MESLGQGELKAWPTVMAVQECGGGDNLMGMRPGQEETVNLVRFSHSLHFLAESSPQLASRTTPQMISRGHGTLQHPGVITNKTVLKALPLARPENGYIADCMRRT